MNISLTKIKKLSIIIGLSLFFLSVLSSCIPALTFGAPTATTQYSQSNPVTKYPGLVQGDYNDQGLPRCYSGGQPESCAKVEKSIEHIAIFIALGFLIVGVIVPTMLVSTWKIFEKAGQEGSAIFRPIHSWTVLLQICRRPDSWIYFLFIPIVNIVAGIILNIDLAKAFGKSTAFGIFGLTLLPPVGYSILAFGKAKYIYAEPALAGQQAVDQSYSVSEDTNTEGSDNQPPSINGV